MKIVELTIENLKRVHAVDITPEADVIQITGKNGSGKTSVLDAISWAIEGAAKVQGVPVRRGEDKGFVRIDFGQLVVTRRFTEKGTTVKVESADGAEYKSPQALLDGLVGMLSFDPMAFARQSPAQQREYLLKEMRVDLDELDAAEQKSVDEAKQARARVKTIKAQYEDVADAEEVEPVDVEAMVGELQAMEEERRQAITLYQEVQRAANHVEEIQAEIDRLAQRHKQVTAEAKEKAAKLEELKKQGIPTDEQIAAKRAAMARVQDSADAAGRYRQKVKLADTLKGAEKALRDAEADVAGVRARRDEKMAEAAQAIPGLAFDSDGVTLGGVPIAQASMAEQIRAGLWIASVQNPEIRVIRITDGSLLDSDSMRDVENFARERDYQVWIERIEGDGGFQVLIQDGSVAEVEK